MVLSSKERLAFAALAKEAFKEGVEQYSRFLARLKKRATGRGAQDDEVRCRRARQKYLYAKLGTWNAEDEAMEALLACETDLEVTDSDEDHDIEEEDDDDLVIVSGSPAGEATPPISPPDVHTGATPAMLDLTITDDEMSFDDSDEDQPNMALSTPTRPHSPELFAPRPSSTPPTSPTSPTSSPQRRKSSRPSKQSDFLGNLVPTYEIAPRLDGLSGLAPKKKKRKLSAEDKGKAKAKKDDAEALVEPVFMTPRVATSVLRLFNNKGVRSTLSINEMAKQNDADEKVLERAELAYEGWRSERKKKCEPIDDIPIRFGLRDGSSVSQEDVETYTAARIGDVDYAAGDFVLIAGESETEPWFARVAYFHQDPLDSRMRCHLQWFFTARAVYGHAAHARHLLYRELCGSVDVSTIISKVKIVVGNDKSAPPDAFFVSCLLKSDRSTAPVPTFDDPTPFCEQKEIRGCFGCEDDLAHLATHAKEGGRSVPLPRWLTCPTVSDPIAFVYDDVHYHIEDDVYLLADLKAQEKPSWNGAQAPFRLGRLLSVGGWTGDRDKPRPSIKPGTRIVVRPYLRLDHIVKGDGSRHERDLVATDEKVELRLDSLSGKFRLTQGTAPDLEPYEQLDTFWVESYLREASSSAVEKAILSAWSAPSPLLRFHRRLNSNLEELILPLNDGVVTLCKYCDEPRVKALEDDEAAGELMNVGDFYKLRALSLYSGVDLLSWGMKRGLRLSFDVAVESDRAAAKACKANHPTTKVLCASVADVLEEGWLAGAGDDAQAPLDVDAVVGGPPCQSFSRANMHKKADDPRSLQPFVFLGYFESGRPLLGLMENVAALATHAQKEAGDVYGLVCDLLLRLGYDIRAGISNAAAYGVAQNRRRLFLQIAKRGIDVPRIPEPTHAVSSSRTRLGKRYEDDGEDKIAYVASTRRAEVHSAPFPAITVAESLRGFPSFDAFKRPVSAPKGCDKTGKSTNVTFGLSDRDQERVQAIGIHGKDGKVGDYRDFAHDPEIALAEPEKKKLKEDYWRRLWEDEISAPLLTQLDPKGSNGARLHFKDDRILSVAEALKLQGGPVDLEVFPLAKGDKKLTKVDLEIAYRLIGNAVAVPVAAAHAREWRAVIVPHVRSHSAKDKGKGKAPAPGSAAPTFFSRLSEKLDIVPAAITPPTSSAARVKAKETVDMLDLTADDEDDAAARSDIALDVGLAPWTAGAADARSAVEGSQGEKRSLDDAEIDGAGPWSDDEVIVVSRPASSQVQGKGKGRKRAAVVLEDEEDAGDTDSVEDLFDFV
ncbi:hypothetical protein JCM10207_002566 [Rhodosporidiobolus poonsookiae]